MILNGHYIYIFPAGAHETEMYFTLTSAQTLYFALLGATIKIDDETTLVTDTDYTMTTANYQNYPGVSHSFTAGSHKIYIDSTNPAVPYRIYCDPTLFENLDTVAYYNNGTVGKYIESCVYDTRQLGGLAQYTSTGKAIFYLKDNYFTDLVVAGKVPDLFLGKRPEFYYNGGNTTSTITYGSWPSVMYVDFTDCSVLGSGSFYNPSGQVFNKQGTYFDNLEEIGTSCYVFNQNCLGRYQYGFTSYSFSKLKKIGRSAMSLYSNNISNYFTWEFPVLEEIGSQNFQGSTSTGYQVIPLASPSDSVHFYLPNIKKIGDYTFINRGRCLTASNQEGKPYVIHIGNKIQTIGEKCFEVLAPNHNVVPATRAFEIDIEATKPPAIGQYTFASYDSVYSRYYYDGNKIKVPSAKVNTYKSATNFSAYSSYISAL